MWCLGYDSATCENHTTARVEVAAGTVLQFTTNYLSENWRRIPIVVQLYINRSVQLLGIPNFVRNSVLSFIENLQDPTIPSGCGGANTSNHNWGVRTGGVTEMSQLPGVVPSLPVRLTWIWVWITCMLMRAASVMTSFVLGIVSLFIYAPQVAALL